MLSKKKIAAIVCISVVAAAALCSCGDKNNDIDSDESVSTEEVTSSVNLSDKPCENIDDGLVLYVPDEDDKDTEAFEGCYFFSNASPEYTEDGEIKTLRSEYKGIEISVTIMPKSESDNVDDAGNIIEPVLLVLPEEGEYVYSIKSTEEIDKNTIKEISISFDVNEAKDTDESLFTDAIKLYNIDLSETSWAELTE